jgi:hypothetical protein
MLSKILNFASNFSQVEGRLFELNTTYVIYYKLKMQQIKDPKATYIL